MSLNKFSTTSIGYDLKLNIGGNELKVNDANAQNIDVSGLTNTTRFKSGNFILVNTIDDFPTPINSIITLEDNKTYFINTAIDLIGSRIIGGNTSVIMGASSENCSITSTGLGVGIPLFSSIFTTPFRNFTIKDVDTAINIDGILTLGNIAIDWTGVNFENVPNIGIIKDVSNVIFSSGAFLNSNQLLFDGSISTVAFSNSLFSCNGTATNVFDSAATLIITRRFRIIYSSIIIFGASIGLNYTIGAVVPTEGFILDTVNFSGGGTYLNGLDYTNDETLFINCTGITNSYITGQLYTVNNAIPTIIGNTTDYYKILGTTTPGNLNNKYTATDNRLTNNSNIQRTYFIHCTLTFVSGSNNVCSFGFYDSKINDVITSSITKSTANSAGRAENIGFSDILQLQNGEFIEIWARNETSATNITVIDMNFTINQI